MRDRRPLPLASRAPSARRPARRLLLLLVAVVPFAQGVDCTDTPRVTEAGRQPCLAYHPSRAPFFGETHTHTTYSFDAVLADTRSDPRDAYAFAQGGALALPPYDASGQALRSAQLQRPLDFAVVTDHAEFFGEPLVCLDPTTAGYASLPCLLFRGSIGQPPGPTIPIGFVFIAAPLIDAIPLRNEFICGPTGADCRVRSESVWLDIQAAAEEAYDRTSACAFTSFVGYEWTANTNQKNLHRNVIFRNEIVPATPTSYFEAQTPQQLWAGLQSTCLDGLPGCDALAIPHNSNISGGVMFETTGATAAGNALRVAFEPLVEIMQHKGESECRTGIGTTDESCGFEKIPFTALGVARDPSAVPPALNFVRNALLEGLVQEHQTGVNPYRFGFVGGTDTHSAAPGAVEEDNYPGHLGFTESRSDYRLATFNVIPGGIDANPGGLTVLWAEENARDSLWRAMKRREAYATSGTRPTVRLFAGYDVPANHCSAPDYAAVGYERGVPMGGELPRCTGCTPSPPGGPRFSVLALQDAGSPGHPGTPLQRVQIVKGWTDAGGATHEAVYDVAGDALNGASVDTTTCTPQGAGFASLCTVWEDPGFDPDERAFYYARVLENPSCRWSQWECVRNGITCSGTTPSTAGFEACCNPAVPKTVQERAWTSPIWYAPGS
jgi:hypothetical protein